MKSTIKEKRAAIAAKQNAKPENSIAVRVVCGLMALLCLGAACFYTRMQPMLAFLFIWAAFAGSYVSYFTRRKRNILTMLVACIGVTVLLVYFALEIYNAYANGQSNILYPFIHVLGGLLALHTLELRTRSDLELNCLIGFGVMCCTMVIGRDLGFGILSVVYIWLASIFFYLDTRSRSRGKGRITPMESAEPAPPNRTSSWAGIGIVVSLLPLTALGIFLCLPRMNSVLDTAAAYFNETLALQPTIPGTRGQHNSSQPGAQAGRPGSANGIDGGSRTIAGSNPNSKGNSSQVAGSQDGSGPPQQKPGGVGATGKNGARSGKSAKGQKEGAATKAKVEPPPDQGPPEDQLVMRDQEAAKYDDELLFEVEATGDFFYRRQVLSKYDGQHWTAGKPNVVAKCRRLGNDHFQELGGVSSLFLPPSVQTSEVAMKITVQSHLGKIIPVVSVPQKLDFPSEPLTVDALGVVRAPKDLVTGTTYQVICDVPRLNLVELRNALETSQDESKARADYADCLELPANMPQEVADLAKQKAGADGNWFVKCERLCKFLRTNYSYTDAGDDMPKGKRDLVDYFLFSSKSGACGPFASAFAVMCRSAGIPTRVIGGFAPGDLNGMNGLREVHGRHGHAWAEVYIPNSGWIPFDATPGGSLPAPLEQDNSFLASLTRNLVEMQASLHATQPPTPPANAKNNATTSNQTPPLPNPKNGAAAKPGPSANTAAPNLLVAPDIKDLPRTALSWLLRGLLVVGLIPLAILLIQAVLETRDKLRSKWGAFKDAKPSTILYLKVLEDLKQYKVDRQPSDTTEELTGRFSSAIDSGLQVHPELYSTLKEFLDIYTGDRFGTVERTKEMEVLRDKIHALARRRV